AIAAVAFRHGVRRERRVDRRDGGIAGEQAAAVTLPRVAGDVAGLAPCAADGRIGGERGVDRRDRAAVGEDGPAEPRSAASPPPPPPPPITKPPVAVPPAEAPSDPTPAAPAAAAEAPWAGSGGGSGDSAAAATEPTCPRGAGPLLSITARAAPGSTATP